MSLDPGDRVTLERGGRFFRTTSGEDTLVYPGEIGTVAGTTPDGLVMVELDRTDQTVLMALTFIPLAKEKIKISAKQYLPIFLSGIFFFIAHLFFFNALSYNVTISQPLAMFGSLFTFLISVVLSKIKPEFLEYHPLRIYALRGVGVLLMLFAAIIMISLS